MRRTCHWAKSSNPHWIYDKITCEVTGEWGNGSKVWTRVDPETGELVLDDQYFLTRDHGFYCFLKV